MGQYKVTTDQGTYMVTTEDDQKMGGKPPLGMVAKQMWEIMPQNPKNLLKNLPLATGALGGASPIPGGAMMGTAVGQGLRSLGDKAFNQPKPSNWQIAGELGGAAIGDIAAIPAIKKSYFGGQIGKAEQAAGMANIEKQAPPSGARTAVKFIQGLKNKMNANPISPEEARSIKPALDMIHRKGWLAGTEYGADLTQISQRINTVVNQIPGRAEAAEGMSRAMTIPRYINKGYQMIPKSVRQGIGYGTGVAAAGGTTYELMKKLLGGL